MSIEEHKDLATFEIYQFYARQHLKRDIMFDSQTDVQRIEKGELVSFCNDFKMTMPRSKIIEVFKKVSPNLTSLTLEQFKASLPHLAMEHAKAKIRELKYKMQEIKFVLEFPQN